MTTTQVRHTQIEQGGSPTTSRPPEIWERVESPIQRPEPDRNAGADGDARAPRVDVVRPKDKGFAHRVTSRQGLPRGVVVPNADE